MEIGNEKGEVCNRNNCKGIIDEREKENGCSCHINPPCSSCVDDRNFCPECEWQGIDDQKEYTPNNQNYEPFKVRTFVDLDKSKIDWIYIPHTHFTMKKVGVYPKHLTESEVRKEVDGTFGGRFTKFQDGEFEFIAYTD